MTRYLLDTNIISSLMRAPRGIIFERVAQAGKDGIYTTIVVAGELRFGARRKGSPKLTLAVEEVLDTLLVAPIEPPLDRVYAELRADLEGRGEPIGDPDLWIAAQALHDDSVLVTDNVREFSRVPRLKAENWLRP